MMNAPIAKLVAPARREVLARRFRACIVCCAGFAPAGEHAPCPIGSDRALHSALITAPEARDAELLKKARRVRRTRAEGSALKFHAGNVRAEDGVENAAEYGADDRKDDRDDD